MRKCFAIVAAMALALCMSCAALQPKANDKPRYEMPVLYVTYPAGQARFDLDSEIVPTRGDIHFRCVGTGDVVLPAGALQAIASSAGE